MNRSLLLCAGILTSLTLTYPALMADSQDTPCEAIPSLSSGMDLLHANKRILRKSIKDESDVRTSLVAVLGMQEGLGICKHTIPSKAESMEGAARTKFMFEYRMKFIALDNELLKLEGYLLKGEHEEAIASLKRIGTHEGEGHERFGDN